MLVDISATILSSVMRGDFALAERSRPFISEVSRGDPLWSPVLVHIFSLFMPDRRIIAIVYDDNM